MSASTTAYNRMGFFWAVVIGFLALGLIFRPVLTLPEDAATRLAFQTIPDTSLIHIKGVQEGEQIPLGVLLAPGAGANAQDIALYNKFDLPARQMLTDRLSVFAMLGLAVAGLALTALIRMRKI